VTWVKGKSGNPRGRPKGTGKLEKLRKAIEDDLPDIIKAVAAAAKSGDTAAAKLLLDRAVPALKPVEQPRVTLPAGGSLVERGEAVLSAMQAGEIAPGEAQAALSALAAHARLVEVAEIEKRLSELEAKLDEQT